MQPGLTTDPQSVNDLQKTAVIVKELIRLDVDIAARHETRLADSGTLREDTHTFFWMGKKEEEKKEHGGFAVRNSLLKFIEPPVKVWRDSSEFV